MRTISGVAASKGIAIGKLCIRQNPAEMKSIFARYFYVSSATYGHNFGYQGNESQRDV